MPSAEGQEEKGHRCIIYCRVEIQITPKAFGRCNFLYIQLCVGFCFISAVKENSAIRPLPSGVQFRISALTGQVITQERC